jgi:hypothetical protein
MGYDLTPLPHLPSRTLSTEPYLAGSTSTIVTNHHQPCIGIARIQRWRRANKLKLNPPLEVLAVLLKNEEVKERAHMDELLS